MTNEDLEQLTRNELVAEVKKLRAGIRKHRHGTRPQFLRGCLRYREPLDAQLPNAARMADEFEGTVRKRDLLCKNTLRGPRTLGHRLMCVKQM